MTNPGVDIAWLNFRLCYKGLSLLFPNGGVARPQRFELHCCVLDLSLFDRGDLGTTGTGMLACVILLN